MKPTLDKLKSDILARYKSIHAFCQNAEELSRSSVYQVLANKYPGDMLRQIEKIRAAISGTEPRAETIPALTAEKAYTILQESKCSHCRKFDKSACPACRTQTGREAKALEDYLRSRED